MPCPTVPRPRRPDPTIQRPRLLTMLDSAASLIVLRAPTGFGKTTLVSDWLGCAAGGPWPGRPGSERTAWLRVPMGGGDPETFWAKLIHALGQADGSPGDPAARAPGPWRSARGIAEHLLAAAGPLLLVVDSFENVTDHGIDVELVETIGATPGLRVLVCLRGRQHFPAELTGRLPTTEITAKHLRFTEDETAALVGAAGLRPGAFHSDVLHADTGGWPELTRLVVSRLADAPPDPGYLARLTVDTAVGYLRRRLAPIVTHRPTLDFPLLTSLPAEFTVGLADAITGVDATAMVSRLESEGLLMATERSGEVMYRWPGAARRALRAELTVRYPDRLPELHRRVALWCFEHGQPATALHHCLQARDWPLAVAVMERHWWTLQLTERDALVRAFTTAPWESLAGSQRVVALRELVLPVPESRLLTDATLPASPGQLTQLGITAKAADIIDNGMLTSMVLRQRGQFARAATFVRRLLTVAATARSVQPAAAARYFPTVNLVAGLSLLLTGAFGDAQHLLSTAYRAGSDRREVPAAAGLLALDHAVLGEIPAAEYWLTRFDRAAVERTIDTGEIRAIAASARLLVALDAFDLQTAKTVAHELPPTLPDSDLWAFVLYAHAQYALHFGDPLGMLDRLQREQLTRRHLLGPEAVATPLLAAAEMALLLSAGRGSQAHRMLQNHGPHSLLQVPAARLALLSGDLVEAQRLATDLSWEQGATTRDRLEMLTIRAATQAASGDRPSARDTLRRAGELGAGNGLLRPFATVPLADLVDQQSPAGVLELLRIAREHRPPYPSSVDLVRLSSREHVVLQQLSVGLTLEQTAEELVVSHNTVKTHVRNIYRKLGTGRREDAIGRARELGLVETRRPPRR